MDLNRKFSSVNRSIFLYGLLCAKTAYKKKTARQLYLPKEMFEIIMSYMILNVEEAVHMQYKYLMLGFIPPTAIFIFQNELMVTDLMTLQQNSNTFIYFKTKAGIKLKNYKITKRKKVTSLFLPFFDSLHIKMANCADKELDFKPGCITDRPFCREGSRFQHCAICSFAFQTTFNKAPDTVGRSKALLHLGFRFNRPVQTSSTWARIALFNSQFETARIRKATNLRATEKYPIGITF